MSASIAVKIVCVGSKCRVVEKSPSYGVVMYGGVELKFHSPKETSNCSVALN